MSEQEVIARTPTPVTGEAIGRDLAALGIEPGDRMVVHSSLSSLGWVCGGAQTVLQALLQSVGPAGTVVMPSHSGDWSDPTDWGNPPVPQEWVPLIWAQMPAFDPERTPTRGLGRIAELFRTYPGTLRSAHPQVSFTANGRDAAWLTADHPLTPQFGLDSPLGKLYGVGAKVLLLGAGFSSCSCFHVAEALAPGMPVKRMGTAILAQGQRTWQWFEDCAYDSDDFDRLGQDYELVGRVNRGKVGNALCRLFSLREAVDFACSWLSANRNWTGPEGKG